jgi:hypothetical protein
MKKYFPLFLFLILGTFIFNSGCKKTTDSSPCDNKGTLCIENKLDSSIVVTIKTTHDQFIVLKNYMHCSEEIGNGTYQINISSTGIDRDTAITILSCDKKLLIVQ